MSAWTLLRMEPENIATWLVNDRSPKQFSWRYRPPSSAPSPPPHSSSDANWVPGLQKKTPLRNKALHSAWFLTRPAAQETLTWRYPNRCRHIGNDRQGRDSKYLGGGDSGGHRRLC